jgi:hypothetical protein
LLSKIKISSTKKEKKFFLLLIAYCPRIKLNKTRGSREALAACHNSKTGKLSSSSSCYPCPCCCPSPGKKIRLLILSTKKYFGYFGLHFFHGHFFHGITFFMEFSLF